MVTSEELRKTLTHQQLNFVNMFLSGIDSGVAYRDAGLNDTGEPDKRKADALLRAPRVAAYIDSLHREVAQRSVVSIEVMEQVLSDIIMTNLSDVMENWNGDVRDLNKFLTPGQKAAINKVKVKQLKAGDGSDEDLLSCEMVEIALADKLKAIDMLMKSRGCYSEKVEHEHTMKNGPMVVIMPGNNNRGPKIVEKGKTDDSNQ